MNQILLIDDDTTNNHICANLIYKLLPEVEVLLFVNPVQALAFLRENPVAAGRLLLLDINMPEMSGWQLLRMMLDHGIHTPVVLLTSSISEQDKLLAAAVDVVHELYVKPIDPGKILALRNYL